MPRIASENRFKTTLVPRNMQKKFLHALLLADTWLHFSLSTTTFVVENKAIWKHSASTNHFPHNIIINLFQSSFVYESCFEITNTYFP